MRITNKFQTPSERTGYRQLNTSGVETPHFLALIVVDLIKLSTENSRRKQLASSVEVLSVALVCCCSQP